MEEVIVIVPYPTDLAHFAQVLRSTPWQLSYLGENELVIESGADRAILRDGRDSMINTYEEHELAEVRTIVPRPAFFGLDFRSIEFLNQILLQIADRDDLAIDDGRVNRGSALCRRIRRRPRQDWRKKRPYPTQLLPWRDLNTSPETPLEKVRRWLFGPKRLR